MTCGVIADGPVPPGPFTFTLTMHPLVHSDHASIEITVGYVPWPPTSYCFTGSWGAKGGLYISISNEDLLDNTATFQLSTPLEGQAVQVRNLSVPKEVDSSSNFGVTMPSDSGTYTFFLWSNVSRFTISMCVDVHG